MSGWGRYGEAQRVRDPLARELEDRGWFVRREFGLPGRTRCDIFAERWPEKRLIECKIRNSMVGVTQVLGYVHYYGTEVTPTLAIPHAEATDILRAVCKLAGVELWVEGSEWHLTEAVRDARGETRIRERFERLADVVSDAWDEWDFALEEMAIRKWEELMVTFRSICGTEPAPRLLRANDGALLMEFPRGWNRLRPIQVRRAKPWD